MDLAFDQHRLEPLGGDIARGTQSGGTASIDRHIVELALTEVDPSKSLGDRLERCRQDAGALRRLANRQAGIVEPMDARQMLGACFVQFDPFVRHLAAVQKIADQKGGWRMRQPEPADDRTVRRSE